MELIPLTSVTVGPRMRQAYTGIDELAKSIAELGLIQPLVLARDNSLLAGGRRYEACKKLGLTSVPFVYKDAITPELAKRIELEENLHRSDLTWQERCCAIAELHSVYQMKNAQDGVKWTYEQTGSLLGIKGQSNVWYAVRLAELLHSGDEEVKKCTQVTDAIRLLVSRKEKEVAALRITRLKETYQPIGSSDEGDVEVPSELVNGPTADHTPWLLAHCHHGNALDIMQTLKGQFDHIYTDPPYAIDMDTVEQGQNEGAMARVREEHDVDSNKALLSKFVPIAYACLPPTGFCVLWYDNDMYEFLASTARSAGFSVQRWPLIWTKPYTCLNQMAYHNFTKATEFAMVLRMPEARLVNTRHTNFYSCFNDKEKYGVTHPFWKPITLHHWILDAIALRGSTVLDPFAGEGSIPAACIASGFKPLAIELSDIHYVALIEHMRKALNEPTPNLPSIPVGNGQDEA